MKCDPLLLLVVVVVVVIVVVVVVVVVVVAVAVLEDTHIVHHYLDRFSAPHKRFKIS